MSLLTDHMSRREAFRRGGLWASGAALGMATLHGTRMTRASAAGSTMGPLVSAQLDFGFRLYGTLAKKTSSTQNLFISPLSIALALAMTYNGARSSTQEALRRALGVGTMSASTLNTTSSALVSHLRTLDTDIDLSIADSLWLRQGVAVQADFAQALQRYYGAQATSLDFRSPAAPGTINAWVSKHTHGLIPTIVKNIPPETILYMINALYFKGPWADPFEVGATNPGPFTLANGKTRTLPMMSKTASLRHYKGAAYEAISLPYGAGKMAMYIVLPSTSSGLSGFQRGLSAGTWATVVSSLQEAPGTIVLPRFSVDYSASLNAALTGMGMGVAFDPLHADLSGMVHLASGERAYISDVEHKTVLKVDEQGTLAAAVTSVGVGATAMPISRFTMTVNRPFFCAIRDETTGALLFMGAIADPQQN